MQKMLEKEEELKLARAWKAGRSEVARARLVQAYQPMIRRIARRYLRAGLQVEDLVQEGSIGFMAALDNFDPDLGYGVGTLARFHVAARIQLHVAEFSGLLRLPSSRKIKGLISQCVSRIRAAENLKGCPLTTMERQNICEAAGFSLSELEEFEMVMRPPRSIVTATRADEDETTLDIADENADTEAELVERDGLATAQRMISEILADMPERTAMILRMRHLSDDFVSLDSIAEKIGISRERVRRIEIRALAEIRDNLRAKGILSLRDVV